MNKQFSPRSIEKILDRDDRRCAVCGTNDIYDCHHVFFKSELFNYTVRHPENGAVVCRECHENAHARGPADKYLKSRALRLFRDTLPDKDISILEGIYAERYGRL